MVSQTPPVGPSGGVNPPSPQSNPQLQEALQEAEYWLNGPPPLQQYSPQWNAAKSLVLEIQSLLHSKGSTLADLTNWYNTCFNANTPSGDIFWQDPGLTGADGKRFALICGCSRSDLPDMTKSDITLFLVHQEMQNSPQGSPDYTFFNQVMDTLQRDGSSTVPISSVVQTLYETVGTTPPFSNYPDISPQAKSGFIDLFGNPSFS